MTALWYIYETAWPDAKLESTALLPVIRKIDLDHTMSGTRCGGVLYHINDKESTNEQPTFITKLEIQSLNVHFWSAMVQTPLLRAPIAIIIPNRREWITLVPVILNLHQFDQSTKVECFTSLEEAMVWLKGIQQEQQTNKDDWPPLTFSNIH